MVETDIDSYKLNSDDRKQSLKISLINNEQISMVLINITTKQRHSVLISLPQLRNISEVFLTSNNIKEALKIIKNTIESGKIMITEDPQNNNIIELRYDVTLENKEYPPFDINLTLEEQNKEEEVQILPPKYELKETKDSKYANLTKSTTEFAKPIIQSNIQPPILELEYIEPILQIHYPDGTTKSKPLPPRIQGVNGETPNITEEQFQSIREQISQNNTIKNFSPLKEILDNRANSVIKRSASFYSNPFQYTNNISRINPFSSADEPKDNKSNLTKNQIINKLNRTASGYSIFTMQAKPSSFGGNDNSTSQMNNTNVFIKSKYLRLGNNSNHNNMVERRPRMVNNKITNTFNPRDANRSLSTPVHEDIHKFNSNQNLNKYQINKADNPFQSKQSQDQINDNNNEKYPYDRNTQRHPLSNNNLEIYSSNLPKSRVEHIERQNKRIQEVKKKLVEIQQQQHYIQKQFALQHQQKNINFVKKIKPRTQLRQQIKIIPKQPNRQNQQIMQNPQIQKAQSQLINYNQQQIKFQSQNNMNNRQFLEHPNSGNLNNNKAQIYNNNENAYKKQASTPLSSKIPSLANKDMEQKLMSLAQMASLQNEENPNCDIVQPVTLEEQSQHNEDQKEIEEYQQKEEEYIEKKNQIIENVNEENGNENIIGAAKLGDSQNLNIEALYFTEEGRVIFRNGLLRGIIHRYEEIDEVVSKIQDKLLKGVKFHLVYKAFDVGDKAKTFHEKCDKLNMSLVLIETQEDARFGGFTTQSWEGNCIKKNDNDAFVFNLNNRKIYDIIPNEPAIGCFPKYGPVFFGCQIRIFDEFFSRGGTTCHKGLNYRTTIDYELNNGEQKFLIKDIEIYAIETIDI